MLKCKIYTSHTLSTHPQVQVNTLNAMSIIDGDWYIIVKGDYAGRVHGSIFDVTNATDTVKPTVIPTTPAWEACSLTPTQTSSATTTAVRKLFSWSICPRATFPC